MSRSYTVDASLILNAFLEEPGHEESHSILRRIHEHKNPVIVPTLLLVEVAATVRRRSEDEGLARAFTQALHALPYFSWVSVDQRLALQATAVASQHGLRGSDAVYVAVAAAFGTVLVTRDREQAKLGADAVTTELVEIEDARRD